MKRDKELIIRPIREQEIPCMEEFLYLAIFQRDENNLLPREVIYDPTLVIYIEDWGKPHDHCLVAQMEGTIVGMVLTRILDGEIKGFGNIDNETPEFLISIKKGYRNLGIGTRLMKEMLKALRQRGYSKTSLAVQKDNYAFWMYEAVGFKTIDENDQEYIMVCDLS